MTARCLLGHTQGLILSGSIWNFHKEAAKRERRERRGSEQSLLSSENIIFVEGVVTMLILGHISPDMLRK